MAGPLSSEEIEDVVSSVRRLVSNEQSPRRVTRDLNAERLLLTPALRIVSEAGPLSPLVLDGQLSEPVAERHSPAAAEVASPEPEAVDQAAAELIEADWEDELWTPPEPAPLGEVALGAEEAEILAPQVDEGSIEIGTAPDELPESWAQAGSEWVEDDPVPFVPLRRRAENLAARLAAGTAAELALTEALAAVAERGLTAKPAPDDNARPDEGWAASDLDSAEADDSANAAQDADDLSLRSAATQRMPTEILDADGTALTVLDEAALQEIVRQMIREELQGALGERITRNVRKLVRAEINRALVARDLD